ncbi:MAG: hypothetical protein M4D80_29770 [Myxococcota bacterium]|nr:hypothetical protein [Myxococcota bacterium]
MSATATVVTRKPSTQQTIRRELRKLWREPVLVLWCLFILLDPIYVVKSGLPQPADFLIILIAPLALAKWSGRLRLSSLRVMRALLFFIGYVVLNALVWSVLAGSFTPNPKAGFLMAPVFYIFDALVFLTLLVLYERFGERFVWLTVRVALFGVAIQVFLTFVYTRQGTLRTFGLFNSSNQLGYYALLTGCILLLGQRRFSLPTLYATAGQLCCCYLALLSASRAALFSAAILVVVAVVNRFRTVIGIGLVAACFTFLFNPFEAAIERSRTRISTDHQLSHAQERGYDRIFQHPEHLLVGAGEGWYIRYKETSAIGTHEIHSSAGTLLFCYGIVGFGLFLAFTWQVARGASIRRMLLLLPPFAFGLTHQGLRFTLFWVVLALVVMLNDIEARAGPKRSNEGRT